MQRSDEKPLDRCSPDEWVLVRDSALHHGLQHESETRWCGNNRSSAYAPSVHIVLVLVLVPLTMAHSMCDVDKVLPEFAGHTTRCALWKTWH